MGTGTTVKIYLPRLLHEAAGATAPTEQNFDDAQLPRGQPGETILVVEDNPGVREYARNVLAELGYDVLDAGNADEASPCFRPARGSIYCLWMSCCRVR
jgi:hypothetical protein